MKGWLESAIPYGSGQALSAGLRSPLLFPKYRNDLLRSLTEGTLIDPANRKKICVWIPPLLSAAGS